MRQFIFSEPFLLFSVRGIKKQSHLRRLIHTKALLAFGKREYFYAYRKWKRGYLCYVQAKGPDDGESIVWAEGSCPLVLHLKDGKYAVDGKTSTYNIDLSGDDCTVIVSNYALDGFRSVKEGDFIPPSVKLRYSQSRREYTFVLFVLSFICLFLLFSNAALFSKISELHSEIRSEMARRKVLYISEKKPHGISLFRVIKEISAVAEEVRGRAFISRAALGKKGEIVFTLRCIKEGCVIPIKGAERVSSDTYRVVAGGRK